MPSHTGIEKRFDHIADASSLANSLIPHPTLLFIHPWHLRSITEAILKEAKEVPGLHWFAWQQKVGGLREGFITNQSLWDRLVYDTARAAVLGEGANNIRAVVVSGGENGS